GCGYPCAIWMLGAKSLWRGLGLIYYRLALGGGGVKLYATVRARVLSSGDPWVKEVMAQIQQNRDEEKEHEEWLEEQIRALGGDDHAPSEKSILVQTEAEGIEHVVMRDPNLLHDFHALLTAELADNAGWELLVELASEFGDRD